jgi:ABC-type amino acid transport substrate-binding protein
MLVVWIMTMRTSLLRWQFVGLLILALVVACNGQESTWDRVQSSGVLRVGLDPTFPPFEFYDGDSLHGIDVDLARAIGAEKGLKVEFSHFGFDGLYDALATEQVDALISALTPDLSRTRDFAYSDGYIESGLVLVSLASQRYDQVEALSDKRVAAELGAAGHVQATTWQRQVPGLIILTYASSDEALKALADRQADVAVVDNITYRLFDPTSTAADFVSAPLTSEPYAIVTRRDDGEFLAEIDDALATLRDSGQLDSIVSRWFPG